MSVQFPDHRDVVPATAKQKSYIIHLEDSLGVDASDTSQMTVRQASDRIQMLRTLREIQRGTEASSEFGELI